jgi:predicted lipoprotein with Yx(FWY)xxD motif
VRISFVSRGAAVAVVAALALSACGSSGKTKTASSTATSEETTSSTAAPSATTVAAAAVVKTKTDAKLGTILADSQGMTLYTLTSNGKAVACSAACAAVWPPLTLPAGVTTATGGAGITGLGTAAGASATMVVTIDGLPLYRFTQDKDSGDAYGEGLQSFGGTWHVVKTGAHAGASTSPTSGGSGY